LLFASVVAALAVPVGFALSIESAPRAIGAYSQVVASTETTLPVVSTEIAWPKPSWPLLPEQAQLIIAGGILFGIAMVVRRAGR
jgi:hypothetical protein